MNQPPADITITLPLAAVQDVLMLFSDLVGRTQGLLEPGSLGPLSPVQRSELEMLVRMTEAGRILSSSLQGRGAI